MEVNRIATDGTRATLVALNGTALGLLLTVNSRSILTLVLAGRWATRLGLFNALDDKRSVVWSESGHLLLRGHRCRKVPA
jgi:hypothetical protein